MATAEKQRKCTTVAALREFLKDLPDKMPVRDGFGDRVEVSVWKADKEESGPRKYVGFDSIADHD